MIEEELRRVRMSVQDALTVVRAGGTPSESVEAIRDLSSAILDLSIAVESLHDRFDTHTESSDSHARLA